jgi:hypothetical protein
MMKTTFDLPPPLLEQTRRLAVQRNTTVKELVIAGLRKVIEESSTDVKPFRLQNASVKGKGLQKGVQHLSPAQVIELSYDRGDI